MQKSEPYPYYAGFVPFALGAFLIGIVGGFTTVLGPAFVKDLNLDYNNTTWTALAMAISTAAAAPIMGKLGDAIGYKTALITGVSVFTLGNILTAMANSLAFMLIARFTVGLGTAAIAPTVMAYIVTEFPREKQAKGFSVYMLISSVAVVLGPTLSGILIEKHGWRTMMWVCVGICIAVSVLTVLLSGNVKNIRRPIEDFDVLGAVFILLFFGLVLCIPPFFQNIGWRSKSFASVLCASVISFAGLVISEKKAKNPILQWDFIKRKPFVLSVIALFLTQGLMQANMTDIIVFVNYTQPENSVISGYAISIMYIGMSLGAIVLGPLADKYEPKSVLVCSFALTGIGCGAVFLFSAETSVILLALSLGVLGFGLGANATVFMKVVLSGLPESLAASGTGTYGLFRDLAAPFGVAVFVPMFTNSISDRLRSGESTVEAALDSIKEIGAIEVICVLVGIATVLLLPKIYEKREKNNET